MTKREKLVLKILQRPANMRVGDVKTLLDHFDFKNVRTKGSHHIFSNGDLIISVPVHDKIVKKTYLEKIIKLLNLEE